MNTGAILNLRSYANAVEAHEHDFFQLVLPISGALKLEIGKEGGAVRQQTMALIPAGQIHCFEGGGENLFVVADVPATYAQKLEHLPTFFDLDEPLESYACFLSQALSSSPVAGGAFANQQMFWLLLDLMCERFSVGPLIDKRVAAAKVFLEQKLHEKISMEQLSRQAHISPRQLSELFRNSLGVTPQQYLLELRMRRAGYLLTQTSLSIQQIAEQVGYSHLSSFSDRFRRYHGCSPQQHRRNAKQLH